jgi:hypothetical protein
MYDSVTSRDIPPGAAMVAGYTDGAYAWSQADWDRHPYARKVRICAVSQDLSAHVCDVENGAMTPNQAAGWASLKWARGEPPTVYISASRLPELAPAFAARGVRYPYIWVALWDGGNGPWYGAVAKQFEGSATSGGHFDLSWVADYWPGVDPAPVQPSPPPPPPPPPPPAPSAYYSILAGDGFRATGFVGPTGLAAAETEAQTYADAHGVIVNVNDDSTGNSVFTANPKPFPPPVGGGSGPPPADAGAAQASFWAWSANVIGHEIPRWLQGIADQLNHLRGV